MEISRYIFDGNEYINIYTDRSHSNGLLRFGHEISVIFKNVNDKWLFHSAWHCGVEDFGFNSDEEEAFEQTFPHLLEKMREQIRKEFVA